MPEREAHFLEGSHVLLLKFPLRNSDVNHMSAVVP